MSKYEQAIEQKEKIEAAIALITAALSEQNDTPEETENKRMFDYNAATEAIDDIPAKPTRPVLHNVIINETNRNAGAFRFNNKIAGLLVLEAIEQLGDTVKNKAIEIAQQKITDVMMEASVEVNEAYDIING